MIIFTIVTGALIIFIVYKMMNEIVEDSRVANIYSLLFFLYIILFSLTISKFVSDYQVKQHDIYLQNGGEYLYELQQQDDGSTKWIRRQEK